MNDIFEEVENTCGHKVRYTLTHNEHGIDIGREFDCDCEICREEIEDYVRQLELKIEFFFGD